VLGRARDLGWIAAVGELVTSHAKLRDLRVVVGRHPVAGPVRTERRWRMRRLTDRLALRALRSSCVCARNHAVIDV